MLIKFLRSNIIKINLSCSIYLQFGWNLNEYLLQRIINVEIIIMHDDSNKVANYYE